MTLFTRFAETHLAPPAHSVRRWAALLLALPLLAGPAQAPLLSQTAAPAAAPILLVEWPAADASEKQAAASATAALRAHLDAGGLTATRKALADLKKNPPVAGTLAIVPWSNGDAAGPEALREFTAGGGHVLLFAPSTSALAEAVGVRADAAATAARGGPGRIELDARASHPLDGAPEQAGGLLAAGIALPASGGNGVLARWDGGRAEAPPAIVETEVGIVVAGRLPETPTDESVRLVVALAAKKTPQYWVEAFTRVRGRVEARAKICRSRAEALGRRVPAISVDAAARKKLADLDAGLAAFGRVTDPRTAAAALPNLQKLEPLARNLANQLVPSEPGEVRGVWIHTYNTTDWDRVMRKVRDAGFNSIFVRVARAGNAIYPSAIIPRDAWAEKAGGDELQRAIKSAHRFGLDFHAWRVHFHMRSAPKSFYERMAADDRLVRGPDDKQSFWLNPGDPRNIELEAKAVAELVRKYDIDGFHSDYIRYPDEPHWDFDYGPVSRATFEKKTGLRVEKWPEDVISGPMKRAYEDWERSNIDTLMERIYRETKKVKPNVQVSAAVWRNHRRYRAVIKQDWTMWVERGWMDFVVPMDYTDDPEVMADTVKAQVAATGGRMPMVAGIGTWLQPGADQVVDQVEISRRAGASGYVLFAYNDGRIESILSALAAGAQRTRTEAAYRAPAFSIRLGNARARKDEPHAATAGGSVTVEVETPASGRKGLSAQVRLEDADGRPLSVAGTLSATQPTLTASVDAPAGWSQVVIRGRQGSRSFVFRGPVLEGVSAEAMAALLAQDVPPVVEGNGYRVGVYAHGQGAENLLNGLKAETGVAAFPIYRLQAGHLAPAQALIVPQLRDTADLTLEAEQALRAWVEQGGRLILTHDAVGFRWHAPAFPEVGRGSALAPKRALQVTLPGKEPWSLQPGYLDYVRLTPAPGAVVLVRETGNGSAPVVISAARGRGVVVLAGLLLGSSTGDRPVPDEMRLVREVLGGW